MSEMEQECMVAVTAFSKKFGVDLKPTDNKKETEDEFSVQFKTSGRSFFNERFNYFKPMFSIWFRNKKVNNFIEAQIKLKLGSNVFGGENTIKTKYRNNEWQKLKI